MPPRSKELHCVAGEVPAIREQSIAQQRAFQPGAEPDIHPQPLLGNTAIQQVDDTVEEFAEEKRTRLQDQLARPDLRQVQYVVDDAQQVLSRADQFVEPIELRRSGLGATQEVREADDGVHRGAYFVAHALARGALGTTRHVGLLLWPVAAARSTPQACH